MGHEVPQSLPLNGLILAEFRPGFASDLSSWRLWIDSGGVLIQVADLCIHSENGIYESKLLYRGEIGADAVLDLLIRAEAMGFADFEPGYTASVTDMPDYRLVIRLGDEPKEVRAYGPHVLALEGDTAMQGFMELWGAIHQYAAYPPKNQQSNG